MPSAVVLEKKKQQVADLSERIKNSVAGVIVTTKVSMLLMIQIFVKIFVKQALNIQ